MAILAPLENTVALTTPNMSADETTDDVITTLILGAVRATDILPFFLVRPNEHCRTGDFV